MADRGIVIEYDFAAMNGAEMLYELTAGFLRSLDGIGLDRPTEARFLAGGNYQGGLQDLFGEVNIKKTAAKAAKELSEAFNAALTKSVVSSVGPDFRDFVLAVLGKGLKVVIATRADVDSAAVKEAFGELTGAGAVLYRERSLCYGSVKWDSWRRACAQNSMRNVSSVAVTGSGFGVKSALVAGMGAVAVVNDHVAYQDFGGADALVDRLDASVARTLFGIMKV
jgi:hypothetical protein